MATGRFAPSPTGDLHLGNLRTAVAAWLLARSSGGRFLLRFEDLDATADPRHADSQTRDLAALGMDWDGTPSWQSRRLALYTDAIADLEQAGLTYRCWCSRREIRRAAVAAHGPPGAYPGTCRDLTASEVADREATGKPPALRLRTGHPSVTITDRLHGDRTEVVDDFVLRRGDGTPAYNLVVVIDDDDHGVEEVVRADDLLPSTPRHAHLYDLLGLPRPVWVHVPLVNGPDGERLAKRHGSVTLADRLAVGDTPTGVVTRLVTSLISPSDGMIASAGPVNDARSVLDAARHTFDPRNLSLRPWTLTEGDVTRIW